MTRAFVFALMCFFLAPAHGQVKKPLTFEQSCEQRLPASTLAVDVQTTPIPVLQTRSFDELGQVQQAAPDTVVLGLTDVNLQARLSWQATQLTQDGTGNSCARFKATITLVPKTHDVYVASELPPGSCSYQKVLSHEMEHVRITEAHLHKTARTLEQLVGSTLDTRVWYGSSSDIRIAIGGYLDSQWNQKAVALLNQVFEAHAALDSDEYYSSNTTACNGELAQLVAPHRNPRKTLLAAQKQR